MNTNTTFDKWKPVGTLNRPFIGTFDGDGHTIRGLYVNVNENYVGLFDCVGAGGTVKNVTIADSYVSGKVNVGDICGRNDGGTVENCTSGCTVKGTGNAVGGICGSNQRGDHVGRVLNCHNTGKVSGKNRVGGVCGGGMTPPTAITLIQVQRLLKAVLPKPQLSSKATMWRTCCSKR